MAMLSPPATSSAARNFSDSSKSKRNAASRDPVMSKCVGGQHRMKLIFDGKLGDAADSLQPLDAAEVFEREGPSRNRPGCCLERAIKVAKTGKLGNIWIEN